MSDKEINKTKDELTKDNFKVWKQELHLILKRLGLEKYIYQEVLTKIDGSTLGEEEKDNLILVDDTVNTYFKKGTKKDDITKDTKTKEILLNSIGNDLVENIDFISSTAYEVYNIIKDINLSDDKDRIEEIKDSLSNMKYDTENSTSLSIFISNMNLKFKELENLKAGLEFKEKFDYLYNAIPEELAIKTNLISHQNNWEDTTKHLINTSQQLKRLKEKREKNKKEETEIDTNLNVESNNNERNNKINNYKGNYNKKYYKKNFRNSKKFIKCRNCGKVGHYASECWEKSRQNKNNYNKNKNYKGRQNKMLQQRE